ncbi:pyruvate kinase, partial [delta proteobacterium NaphS2]
SSRKALKELIMAGMDVARLNFSHGTHEAHGKVANSLKSLSKSMKRPIAIMLDLQGPKIRTGLIKGGHLTVNTHDLLTITTREVKGDSGIISTTYRGITKDLQPGDRILMDDGLIELKVQSKNKTDLLCEVTNGGIIGEHKGINLPGITTGIHAVTEKDRKDLDFGLDMGIDYVALSFVRGARDVEILKRILKKRGADIPVISKIEKPQALDKLDEILEASDGVMVARGDLGVELSPEQVPVAQKNMIALANQERKMVITATQMLESMTEHPLPTRAETSDVANAILDGTDAVMLSGETSVGKYPAKAVKMMARIARVTERNFPATPPFSRKTAGFSDTVSEAACLAAENLGLDAIVAFSQSGFTARLISKYRPPVPIIAFTTAETVQRSLALCWGVKSLLLPVMDNSDVMIEMMEEQLRKKRLVKKNDRIVIVGGHPLQNRGKTNMMKLHVVGEK